MVLFCGEELWASSPPQLYSSIALGLGLGCLLLAFIYFAFKNGVLKIPTKAFFRVTSALLYFLSITIAGKAVVELQAGGFLKTTSLESWPTISPLGFYPTLENLLVQSLIIGALVTSLSWVGIQKVRRRLKNNKPADISIRPVSASSTNSMSTVTASVSQPINNAS
jgi:high-affinity iron transporter